MLVAASDVLGNQGPLCFTSFVTVFGRAPCAGATQHGSGLRPFGVFWLPEWGAMTFAAYKRVPHNPDD